MADPGCRDVIELLFGLRAVRRLLGGTIKAITKRVTPTFIPGWSCRFVSLASSST
jgi:hypothetical protein